MVVFFGRAAAFDIRFISPGRNFVKLRLLNLVTDDRASIANLSMTPWERISR
jgi:hypothetical protein